MKISYIDVNNWQSNSFKLHRENGMDDYLFVLFKTPAYVYSDGSYVKVDMGKCIFFDKHKIQSYYPESGLDFIHDFIHIYPENNIEEMLFSSIPLGKVIDLLAPQLITDIISAIKSEKENSYSSYKEEILSQLGIVFLYRLKNEVEHTVTDYKKRKSFKCLYDIRDEIYRSPNLDWSIDGICKRSCLSRSYFQHLYQDLFGISCVQDIINARIDMAKSFLLNSNLKINEIAEKCGYNTTEHFIRQFKSCVGMTPQKFRNK